MAPRRPGGHTQRAMSTLLRAGLMAVLMGLAAAPAEALVPAGIISCMAKGCWRQDQNASTDASNASSPAVPKASENAAWNWAEEQGREAAERERQARQATRRPDPQGGLSYEQSAETTHPAAGASDANVARDSERIGRASAQDAAAAIADTFPEIIDFAEKLPALSASMAPGAAASRPGGSGTAASDPYRYLFDKQQGSHGTDISDGTPAKNFEVTPNCAPGQACSRR